jgi:alpha-L-fucosidase
MGSLVRRGIAFIAVVLFCLTPALGQENPPTANARDQAAGNDALNGWWTAALKNRDERLAWWRDARFGCFIHWGAYSVYGGEWDGHNVGGYAEHLMRLEKIPLAVYKEKVVGQFDPENFDADKWVALIKAAGMKYVVITSKHHDGFAMWPSDVYKYDIRDNTKFKRDPMQELSDACHRNGIHFGFYYSHAFDWEHPDAPGNDWDYQNPGGDLGLFGGATWYDSHPELVDKVKKYVDEKCIPQLQELIRKYHPEIFWFDVGGKLPFSEQIRIVKAVRAADPNVVINGRAARGMGKNFGDYVDTSDNPVEIRPTPGDWECIPTVNNSYGYHKLDNHYKTPAFFVRLLAKTAAKGGNMLLNIGPMGDGRIDPNATAILSGIGQWMAVNGDSIHGTTRTPLDRQAWGDSTLKGDTLYLHIFQWPADDRLVVAGLQSNISSAYLLADPAQNPLSTERLNDNDLVVHLPVIAPDQVDSVVALKLAEPIKALPGFLLSDQIADNRLLAYDGKIQGGKVTYGDGKAGNYGVAGFSHDGDSITWSARLNAPAEFDVAVGYSTTSADQTGEYQLKIGDQTLTHRVVPTKVARSVTIVNVGQVKLPAGENDITLSPVNPDGPLMTLFEIHLYPKNLEPSAIGATK